MTNQSHTGAGDNVAGNKQVKNFVSVNSIWPGVGLLAIGLAILLIFLLQPDPLYLSGTIMDSDGPVAGAEVKVSTGEATYEINTDASGNYSFEKKGFDLRKVTSFSLSASKTEYGKLRKIDTTYINFNPENASFNLNLPDRIPLKITLAPVRRKPEENMNSANESTYFFNPENGSGSWEICSPAYADVLLDVTAEYLPSAGAPDCHIKEWGIAMTKAESVPLEGKFDVVPYGGAESSVQKAEAQITSPTGEYPLTAWYAVNQYEDYSTEIQAYAKHFKANEAIKLKVTVNKKKEKDRELYKGFDKPNGPENTDAVHLRVYIKTRINGIHYKFYSDEYIKMLILNDNVSFN